MSRFRHCSPLLPRGLSTAPIAASPSPCIRPRSGAAPLPLPPRVEPSDIAEPSPPPFLSWVRWRFCFRSVKHLLPFACFCFRSLIVARCRGRVCVCEGASVASCRPIFRASWAAHFGRRDYLKITKRILRRFDGVCWVGWYSLLFSGLSWKIGAFLRVLGLFSVVGRSCGLRNRANLAKNGGFSGLRSAGCLPRVRGSPDSKPGERWALRSRPSFPAVVSWSADFSLPLRRCSRSCSGFPSVALLRSGLTNRVGVVASGRLRPLFCPLALPHRRAVSGGNSQTSPFCPLRCALLAFVGRSGMFYRPRG